MKSFSLLLLRSFALISFLLYALSVLALQEEDYSGHSPENFAIAAAVSHVSHGASIGTLYDNIKTRMLSPPVAFAENMDFVSSTTVNQADLLPFNPDGVGFGYTLFATLALKLFGSYILSLTAAFILVMSISTLLMILRFKDARLVILPFYFTSLTLLCFSPLTDLPYADEIFIGGIRYFSLLAILPALQLILVIPSSVIVERPVLLLSDTIQLLIICFVIWIRGSTAYLLAAIVCGYGFMIFYHRHTHAICRFLRKRLFVFLVLCVAFFVAFYALSPAAYRHTGRVFGHLWHRAVISMGVNPEWPFGDLYHQNASCLPDFPSGLTPGIFDANGYCMWDAYSAKQHIPYHYQQLLSGQYSHDMRVIFFGLLQHYPGEVLTTLLIYKPMGIMRSLNTLFLFHVPGDTVLINRFFVTLLAMQCAILLTVSLHRNWLSDVFSQRLLRIVTGFGILTLPTYIAAWSVPHTSAEIFFYIICLAALLLTYICRLLLVSSFRFLRRPAESAQAAYERH